MKMRKKNIMTVLILAVVCFVLLCCSCSAKMGSGVADKEEAPSQIGAGISADEYYDSETGTAAIPHGQKIIQNLYLAIEVSEVEDAYSALLDKAVFLGGYEFERNYSRSGDYQSLHAVIKVPAGRLNEFSHDAEEIGNIINNELMSEDISDSYYDTQTRLNTMEKTLEKYYEFLEKAGTLQEQLEITRQIDELTYEIEALKGRIAKWDTQVNYATVTLRIYQYDDPIARREKIEWNSLSFDDMWYLTKSGFTSFTGFVVSALQWLVIILASTVVLTAPGLAILIFFLVRRHKKKKASKEMENKENS